MLFLCLIAFPPNPSPPDKFLHILQTQCPLFEAIHHGPGCVHCSICAPRSFSITFVALKAVVLNCGCMVKTLGLLCKNTLAWTPPLGILMSLVWGGVQGSVFSRFKCESKLRIMTYLTLT